MRFLRFLALGLAAIAVLAAAALYVWVYAPPDDPPPIAENLPNDFAEAADVFWVRVGEKFGDGVAVRALIQELEAQGFEVHLHESGGWADFRLWRFPCTNNWEIAWRNDGGVAVEVAGRSRPACL